MRKTIYLILVIIGSSCNLNTIAPISGVSDSEIVQGLKEALTIGTDSAVGIISKADGYFANELIKIFLPKEAQSAISTLRSTSGGEFLYQNSIKSLEDNLVLSLNRAAENAAPKALPIIESAVTGMTITDGKNILFGSDSAATNYLRNTTYQALLSAYAPQIDSSLSKPLLLGVSANGYWSAFLQGYNLLASGIQGNILGLTPISNSTLGSYVTDKALTGLFVKLKVQELAIRKNPVERVTSLLQKVFGQLDAK